MGLHVELVTMWIRPVLSPPHFYTYQGRCRVAITSATCNIITFATTPIYTSKLPASIPATGTAATATHDNTDDIEPPGPTHPITTSHPLLLAYYSPKVATTRHICKWVVHKSTWLPTSICQVQVCHHRSSVHSLLASEIKF